MLTKTQIKNAGKVLRKQDFKSDEYDEAYSVLSAYRMEFGTALFTVNMRCRNIIKKCFLDTKRFRSSDFIIAQRLKRLESIVMKLDRFPSMGLDTMQDIGGVRVILPTQDDVNLFLEKFPGSRSKIKVNEEKCQNYILKPKEDGYRSFHYVLYVPNAKSENLPILKIELQVRTHLQHAWATAVEVAGLAKRQSFKTGDWEADWKNFFIAVGDLFEQYENYNKNELNYEAKPLNWDLLNQSLQFTEQLKAMRQAIKTHTRQQNRFSKMARNRILILDFSSGKPILDIPEDLGGSNIFEHLEKGFQKDKSGHILRFNIDDVKKLSKAYPNYFMDTKVFVQKLEAAKKALSP
jgi:ppGpp synthetase/RelA/SpoT-type nucleotidyltranferase